MPTKALGSLDPTDVVAALAHARLARNAPGRAGRGLSLAFSDVGLSLRGQLRVSDPVTVARDAQGVPTLTGRTRADLAWALGYLHGQERFFQMDGQRRSAAGELSDLVGRAALGATEPSDCTVSGTARLRSWPQ